MSSHMVYQKRWLAVLDLADFAKAQKTPVGAVQHGDKVIAFEVSQVFNEKQPQVKVRGEHKDMT